MPLSDESLLHSKYSHIVTDDAMAFVYTRMYSEGCWRSLMWYVRPGTSPERVKNLLESALRAD